MEGWSCRITIRMRWKIADLCHIDPDGSTPGGLKTKLMSCDAIRTLVCEAERRLMGQLLSLIFYFHQSFFAFNCNSVNSKHVSRRRRRREAMVQRSPKGPKRRLRADHLPFVVVAWNTCQSICLISTRGSCRTTATTMIVKRSCDEWRRKILLCSPSRLRLIDSVVFYFTIVVRVNTQFEHCCSFKGWQGFLFIFVLKEILNSAFTSKLNHKSRCNLSLKNIDSNRCSTFW